MGNSWLEVKRGCDYHLTDGGVNFCEYNHHNCRPDGCPQMEKAFTTHQAKQPRCPTCNSTLSPLQWTNMKKSWQPFVSGMMAGAIGAVACVVALVLFAIYGPYDVSLIISMP